MPKGVICGGAVDGSNQLGEMVTCQAITARPDGAASAGVGIAAQRVATAIGSNAANARRKRKAWHEVIRDLQPKTRLLLGRTKIERIIRYPQCGTKNAAPQSLRTQGVSVG